MSSKVQDLPAAGALDESEILYLLQAAADKHLTIADLITYILNGASRAEVAFLANLAVNVQQEFDDINAYAAALNTAVQGKADVEWASKSGGFIRFDVNAIYGTIASPVTTDITFDGANRKKGTKILIIHQKAVAPTFAAQFVERGDSMGYDTGTMNFIECQLMDVGGTFTVHYKIYQI